jgi:hypothetical protein
MMWFKVQTAKSDAYRFFSFSTAKTDENLWKILGKTKLVVWWFDVMNKIKARVNNVLLK